MAAQGGVASRQNKIFFRKGVADLIDIWGEKEDAVHLDHNLMGKIN